MRNIREKMVNPLFCRCYKYTDTDTDTDTENSLFRHN